MTTFSEFVANISSIDFKELKRNYSAPPASLNTSDLPCSFPMLPSGEDNLLVFCGGDGGGNQLTFLCDMVYVYEPIGQGTQTQNYSGLLGIVDSAIDASRKMARPTLGPATYSLRIGSVTVAGNDYWAVIQSWRGAG